MVFIIEWSLLLNSMYHWILFIYEWSKSGHVIEHFSS